MGKKRNATVIDINVDYEKVSEMLKKRKKKKRSSKVTFGKDSRGEFY